MSISIINEELDYTLQGLVSNLVTLGLGREAAFAAGLLGDNALMEKAWQDTGMLAEAVLHAQVRVVSYKFIGYIYLIFSTSSVTS